MSQGKLSENEIKALAALKRAINERYGLLDFRVFGSKARGDASPESDIDVMIELEEYNPEIESAIDDLLYEINLANDCFISAVIFTMNELEEGPMSESPLYKAIEREGIRI